MRINDDTPCGKYLVIYHHWRDFAVVLFHVYNKHESMQQQNLSIIFLIEISQANNKFRGHFKMQSYYTPKAFHVEMRKTYICMHMS